MQAFFLNNEQNVLFVWVIVLKIDCFCFVCGKMIFDNRVRVRIVQNWGCL